MWGWLPTPGSAGRGYALAFATVLPGVLLGAEVLDGPGGLAGPAGPAADPAPGLGAGGPAGGHGLPGPAPGLGPATAFPLVWGAGFFLLDPFVKLLGGRSLIQAWLRRANAGSTSAC